jgi:hypothetical protein
MATALTAAQIKHMVDRFLGWKLPEAFHPDAGISFKPTFNDHLPTPTKYEPSGTNLFDASQAEAMVRHMADEMPGNDGGYRWLIEAPGQRYFAARKIGTSSDFYWTQDHDKALYFMSEAQADAVMMAVRQLAPALFAFAVTLGDARAVEHAWL